MNNIKSEPAKKSEDQEIDLDKTIKIAHSKDLCDYVAMYRVFKIGKDNAIKCMVELDRRQIIGDEFNYQEYIKETEEKFKKELEGSKSNGITSSEIFALWKNSQGS